MPRIRSAIAAGGLLAAALCAPALAVEWRVPGWDGHLQGAAFEGDRAALRALAASGARVLRVYRQRDAWVLDEAERLGMKVVMGLWIEHRRHGARLDEAELTRLAAEMRAFVTRYRHHPALLAWSVGNEVETAEPDPRPLWRVVDRLAAEVKRADPVHPTMMVVADSGPEAFRWLADCCRHVDILGLNVYAGAVFDLPRRLREAGIAKPVVVTELGPLGQWQAGRKPWGAPVEPDSRQKAEFFRQALPFLRQQPQIIGALAFLWGAKQEQTETWHGLLLADGSATEMSDALATLWGRPPARPAPTLRGIGIAADEFAPGAEVSAGADVVDADGRPARLEWKLLAEASDLRLGGDEESRPARIDVAFDAQGASVRFRAPSQPGAYRLFLTARDAHGKAATANLPFRVRP